MKKTLSPMAKAKQELRAARKAHANAKYRIRAAEENLSFATKRLIKAAAEAGERP